MRRGASAAKRCESVSHNHTIINFSSVLSRVRPALSKYVGFVILAANCYHHVLMAPIGLKGAPKASRVCLRQSALSSRGDEHQRHFLTFRELLGTRTTRQTAANKTNTHPDLTLGHHLLQGRILALTRRKNKSNNKDTCINRSSAHGYV